MKRNRVGIVGLALLALAVPALQGCATGANRKLDEKLAQETPLRSRRDLRTEAAQEIAKAKDLSSEQRTRLVDLKASVGAQMDDLRRQSLKLRSLLIQDLLAQNCDMDEVDLIQGRLAKLEKHRLDLLFHAVKEANSIMGRNSARNEDVYTELFQPHDSRD